MYSPQEHDGFVVLGVSKLNTASLKRESRDAGEAAGGAVLPGIRDLRRTVEVTRAAWCALFFWSGVHGLV